MLWLSDNTYLREGDFESRNGICIRQSHTRNLLNCNHFLQKCHIMPFGMITTMGQNDSDWTSAERNIRFKHSGFWPNEAYGAGQTEGVTSGFIWNDCAFYCLDDMV